MWWREKFPLPVGTQTPNHPAVASVRYIGKCFQRGTGYMKVTVKKKRKRQTNSRMTIDNFNLVHL
jgi:hypothetical protein